jgi:hypothetical protein
MPTRLLAKTPAKGRRFIYIPIGTEIAMRPSRIGQPGSCISLRDFRATFLTKAMLDSSEPGAEEWLSVTIERLTIRSR